MSENTPNEQQQKLINATTGIHLVDAGAGTGKTFTVTRRYATILEREGIEPEDVLLLTFTNNAADEMTERIVAHGEYGMAELRDAPISTFHSLCHDVLTRDGFEAPAILGIDDRITSTTQVLDNEVIERERFRTFLTGFMNRHPEYEDYFRAVSNYSSLLGLIKQLAAKGVFPTHDGWFRNSERYLDGDFEAFRERFAEANAPNEGARGPTQSDLRGTLNSYGKDRCYLPDAPDKATVRGDGKRIDAEWADRAFEEDRSELKEFIHDLYFEYLEFALGRNYLNFSFLLLFAFALLCEDHALREELAFEYTMIDEFQDTSEIQFKLALLLTGTDNLCVVGDWKQSIYSFQYASVDNIRQFEDRLERYKEELNGDAERVDYPVTDVGEIPLTRNYRSTQSVLDFSERSLTLEATKKETIDEASIRAEIVSLTADSEREHSRIVASTSDDEHEALCHRIQGIVDNPEYSVENEDGELRPPSYADIAVLTRTRRFGREFQTQASEHGFPVAYEGGVELFSTDQALLLLAWLRILEDDGDRGWAVVLERAGYTLDEANWILDTEAYPSNMETFREELRAIETIGGVARRVFDRYGFDDAYADTLVTVLDGTFSSTHMNRGDIVRFVERSIEAESTHEVDDSPGVDSITVQTIHAAKGLEHPIVILANIDRYSFPPSGGGGNVIRYDDTVGLRQTEFFSTVHDLPYIYHSWRHDIRSKCLPPEYDEERRLMYVAMTRAKDHLLFSAGSSPSPFFENLPLDPETIEPDVRRVDAGQAIQTQLQVSVPRADTPRSRSPHSLIDDSVFEEVADGMGTEFGRRVHEFAEHYAEGTTGEPSSDDERHIRAFLDALDGEFRVEEHASLPLMIDDQQVTISGIIDLLCVTPGTVEIVDYKTDRGRHAQPEYRKQVSVYYHVVRQCYPDRDVSTSVFYTEDGERVPVEPLSMGELSELIRQEMRFSDATSAG